MPTLTPLSQSLGRAREQTDALFRLIRPDSLYERPIPERHRIVFYAGHLEAFDWNLIARYALGRAAFHPAFDKLFAFGIDPPAGRLPEDQPSDWPAMGEVESYNARVRDEIDALAGAVPEQLLHVAIEHRLMHAETFAYMLHQLPYDRKAAPAAPAAQASPPPRASMIEIPAGRARLGIGEDDAFGWDNELQPCEVDVPAFRIGRYKVTNGEYLEFVRAGAAPPFFWARRNGQWLYRGMFAESPLPMDAPVYVTQREAAAYAEWRGMRLPSEPEFHRAAELSPPSRNVDFRAWDPVAVTADDLLTTDAQRHGEDKGKAKDATSVPQRLGGEVAPAQMRGNGWEWTSTVFAPFPGFAPFPFYANYSAPFFDGDHYVIKGASPRTAAPLLRPSFRNWFRASYPYAYTAFRLAES
jgi:gamma-glutamyl hercynylcysteine S-oxide synthase